MNAAALDIECEWTREYSTGRRRIKATVYCGGDGWTFSLAEPVRGQDVRGGYHSHESAKRAATSYMRKAGYGAMGMAWEEDE